ncbi:hypothetical protein BDN71DRAFT_1415262 [Pleurotus eryngii]|uniref:BRCT domain-containing protein n=1 Tax=Pleurotus eryngii TaxID=5323 RepID=A0A9P6DGH6_PLEER|nr:hypothetical protein BDN71DRAFT_1415262 [Pleurotus eryngii]
MRRRSNKSAKVPNVKLRPAQQSQSNSRKNALRAEESVCLVDESQFGSDDNYNDYTPRPLRGVVVCATGIADKPTLFKQAVELGALAMSAFTDRVTHLVAVGHGGAKYMCAVERKIPILQPSWITECFQVWLRGDDVDVAEMTNKHRLPVFSDIVLCPSGIADITRRTQIHRLVTEHGGTYVKNLERPVRVTHLLCSGEEETDKMRYAEKFNSTGEAKPPILLVWEEWFWDSLEFGGRFDEDKYQVRRPRPERKTITAQPTTVFEDSIPSSLADSSSIIAPKPRGDEQDPEEAASVKVLPAVTLQLWESLLKVRGYEISPGGKLARSPTKVRSIMAHIGAEPESPSQNGQRKSVIDKFRRANSFAEPASQGFRRTKTIPALALSKGASFGKDGPRNGVVESPGEPGPSSSPHRTPLPPSSRSPSPEIGALEEHSGPFEPLAPMPDTGDIEMSESEQVPAVPGLLYSGKIFRALGEASCSSVREAIESQGGRLVEEKAAANVEVDYILVRLVSGSKYYHDEASQTERQKYRTECWLERCMFEERIISPSENITFAPLELRRSIPGVGKIVVSLSGLDQSEVCCVKRLAKALGILISPNFSRRSTHLLCPAGTGAKFEKAKEWGIPVVNMGWLEGIAKTGRVIPVSGFQVGPGGAIEEAVLDPGKTNKGKGKAIESPIVDITNSGTQDDSTLATPEFAVATPSQASEVIPKSAFGVPNGLLDAGTTKGSHVAPTKNTLPEASSDAISPNKDRVDSPDPLGHCPKHPSLSPSQPYVAPLQAMPDPLHRSNPFQDDDQRDNLRIPSSSSPSPMKLAGDIDGGRQTVPSSPSKGSQGRHISSPTKMSAEAAIALQKSLTSLLGKRRESDEDPTAQAGTSGAAGTRAKRARPQRSKGQARQTAEIRVGNAPVMTVDPFGPYNLNHRHASDDMYEDTSQGSVRDEIVGVKYEDPKQREERQRLMDLLGGSIVDADGESKGKSRVGGRRPTRRKAGF